ncbi:MAG: transcription-repair coupling factor [Gemmatimonadales bacterium]
MTLAVLTDALCRLGSYRSLTRALPAAGTELTVSGLPGAAPAVLLAALSRDHPQRAFLVVACTPAHAERWLADLDVLVGEQARLYPQREAFGEEEPHLEIAGERVETMAALMSGSVRVVVTTLAATLERTRMAESLARHRLEVERGTTVPLGDLVEGLERMGYERRPSVVDVAQFAVRGGIVDVYGFGMAAATRIEWWGDEIISLRAFDLDSQRSEGETDRVTVLPVRPAEEIEDLSPSTALHRASSPSLLDLVPTDTLVVIDHDVDRSQVERIWVEAEHHVELARRRGEDVPGREAVFQEPGAWGVCWKRFPRLRLSVRGDGHDFGLGQPPPIERNVGLLARAARNRPTIILCDNEGQLERLDELLFEDVPTRRASSTITLALGSLSGGFALPDLLVLTDHEIFRRSRRLRRPRRYRQALASAGIGALKPGSLVVHLEHGIGLYRGIEAITLGEGAAMEVAVLEYEGGDRLNVPLYRLDQLEPYRTVGDDAAPPRLDRLGGSRWSRRRAKTQSAIRRMASELLELYAKRSLAGGFAFPPDTRWQRELESSFLYEDTPDQRRATDETKRDMERPSPMDRLVVGDVGYGKTEVAVRAAFKAVQASKQVAVLVPTTILAEQHGRTFRERLAGYPVEVAVLSRFRTPAEQRRVLADLGSGKVDVVIGTHRLLSRDVQFRDLGLLVVDEEHRFGVRHKERLKAMRLEVDILTLTATPIPRTLHLALAGLRDLTLIETPPRDRSPVVTLVEPWDDELIEEVIAHELDRGGQVFFVHNRIETIETITDRVRRLAPPARVAVAHGKMRERDLDDVMRRFVAGEVDVLVSTMIVESGLDVPNANSMIVHDAQQFGLAQLYQLRGRVGRGSRRAQCVLVAPDNIDPDAERRLQVLEHHTELGSGYRIALRDLELRGAGNLLGAEQSGHAHAVGFDLYMRWLDETVRALKGEEVAAVGSPPDVTIDRPARLPDRYVCDDDAKFDLYRRLARAMELGEIAAIRDELRDRFGPLPEETEHLLVVSELRALGARLGLDTVRIAGNEARMRFRRDAAPRLTRLTVALDDVQFAADVRQSMPLSLKLRRLGGIAIGPGLVRALARVVEE